MRGFEDKRDLGWVETYSGTMDPGMMHTAIIYALNRGFKAVKADVQSAFLKAESDDELYLRMPNDIPKEA